MLRLAPPVMLAQLIQALYNIVDSLFVGRYSSSGLTALSIIYPIQLLMIAFAVGTGVGINTVMASKLGTGDRRETNEYAGVGTPLAVVLWILFSVICFFIMPFYARMSTESEKVISDVIVYGRIVCVFSFGLFLESVWTKILQSNGDMKTPMFAQIIGAVTNIVLDPILIFGLFGLPEMGIAGAAAATVAGQIVAALVVMKKGFHKSPQPDVYPHHIAEIFRLGVPNILMQSAYTFYILGLNMILASFSDQAVTALGLYYKCQTFFFIPLGAMQTCIVPIIIPVFFQAVGSSLKSSALTVIRTVVLFVPLGYIFSRFGLTWFWLAFPVTETLTSAAGAVFYRQFLRNDYVSSPVQADDGDIIALKPSKPGVIITIAREHGSSGKQIGKLVAQKLGIPFYYKEMVALAAYESGLDREFISDIHKNAPDALRELYLSSQAVRHAIEAQDHIIRKIADNGSCVIVGRAADYVLKDYKNVIRVFVHAPLEYRIGRIGEVTVILRAKQSATSAAPIKQERLITGIFRGNAGAMRIIMSLALTPPSALKMLRKAFWNMFLKSMDNTRV